MQYAMINSKVTLVYHRMLHSSWLEARLASQEVQSSYMGVQSENPKKKKIRKSPDFRPDFPSVGDFVPLLLLDNPGTQKIGYVVQRHMVYVQLPPLSM